MIIALWHFPPLQKERGLGGEAQIATLPYDLTKPIMIFVAPRNDVKGGASQ